ncbi:MAG TPA: hypothetical protein PLP07_08485 [Pyrinomonadaceae bacterium]|nr:hypothetical protein [Chloracidobacterium sp.]MBP9108089.1 hypothetical protein [Pyrinomonadaceae bacterium]MBK7802096.1 hypothetical protein [Chloracidobacterium sp.]MBK9437758.1 hypothetical protein [Chloracidobacterium sp.]MBL0239644.1 hypothetical protein [Chloracidobacterium sp.]
MVFENGRNRLDLITNILTIIVAVVFIAMAVQRYALPAETSLKAPPPGRAITFENFDPTASNRNVLLVMMKGCRFCEESMVFYRSLLEQYRGTGVRFIAVFPPNGEDLDGYLIQYGITGMDVRYSELSGVDVQGTPTIIVTDESGIVTKSWVGKLSKEKEKEVIAFLNS